MMSSKTSHGGQIIADRGNKALSQDAVRLLKTQDAGYLRTMAQIEGRKRRKLQAAVVMGEVGDRLSGGNEIIEGRHMLFVESREEQKAFNVQEHLGAFEDGAKTLGVQNLQAEVVMEYERSTKRAAVDHQSRRAIEQELQAMKSEQTQRKKKLRAQEVRKKMLEVTRLRERELIAAGRELEIQRAKMGKTPTVGGINKGSIKWKCRERKR
jgi:Utp11 protein